MTDTPREPATGVAVAVLGDSDSHAYHDPLNDVERGGEFADVTHQWTAIWAALRPDEIDLGARGDFGTRNSIAHLRYLLSLPAKSPRKRDFRHNFAISSTRCESLSRRWPYQTKWLRSLLKADPQRWADGLVFIRIGVNDFGQARHLDVWARTGLDASASRLVDGCLDDISNAVEEIREVSATVNIALVGIAHDYNAPPSTEQWQTVPELARIDAVLDHFDAGLQALAAGDPHIAYLDDKRWVSRYWGGRDADGRPAYHPVFLGGTTPVTNTAGDAPSHRVLADGHAGTVANGLWLASVLSTLNERFGYRFSPIADAEIASLADPEGRYGIAPP